MKRFAVLVMVVLSVSLFFACDLDPDLTPIEVKETSIKYVRYGIPKSMWNRKYLILKSAEQRDEYIELLYAKYAENARDPKPLEDYIIWDSFTLALNKYSDNFFDTSDLVMILRWEPHTGISHKVDKIGIKNSNLYIRIKRMISVGGAIPVGWHILVPIKKKSFNGDKVVIEYCDTKRY